MDKADIVNRFKYHPPKGDTVILHQKIRMECFELAIKLDTLLPDGREKAVAFTNLEQVMFWSNACIARNQGDISEEV